MIFELETDLSESDVRVRRSFSGGARRSDRVKRDWKI